MRDTPSTASRGSHRWTTWWWASLALLALGLLLTCLPRTLMTQPPTKPPVTLDELQRLSTLTCLSVPWEQMIESRIDGYVGGVRCLLLARGEITVGSDLSQAELTVNESQKLITITLPQPMIASAKIDMATTRILAVTRRGLWHTIMSEAGEAAVIAAALVQAEAALREQTLTETIVADARRQTESVLVGLVAATDWQVITRWKPASP